MTQRLDPQGNPKVRARKGEERCGATRAVLGCQSFVWREYEGRTRHVCREVRLSAPLDPQCYCRADDRACPLIVRRVP